MKVLKLFFDEKMLSLLVDQTVLLPGKNSRHKFTWAALKMRSFIGFLLFTGTTNFHKNICIGPLILIAPLQ